MRFCGAFPRPIRVEGMTKALDLLITLCYNICVRGKLRSKPTTDATPLTLLVFFNFLDVLVVL